MSAAEYVWIVVEGNKYEGLYEVLHAAASLEKAIICAKEHVDRCKNEYKETWEKQSDERWVHGNNYIGIIKRIIWT